ncbi:hypothetical protein [Grimontia sp. NTOU-MAR1]|uniref:hypothetical protein n=1 Tax=Grimontia sp. NTOU-MAR1 TaxID=3111011 RepID=UPI002DB62AB2|nr:hypothetical protein [Grimontia sp. NTOU-MAR1]WRW00768.1 hypothetical protein VP504_20185 [Grimontia sp. NTOU-MAR1]
MDAPKHGVATDREGEIRESGASISIPMVRFLFVGSAANALKQQSEKRVSLCVNSANGFAQYLHITLRLPYSPARPLCYSKGGTSPIVLRSIAPQNWEQTGPG